jgi:CelD/BcsL family acetyltransferase involved in cellulose biosynthesis
MLTMVGKQESACTPLIVETLCGGVEVIERLAAEWRALGAEGRCQEPFFQPAWIAAHIRAFARDKSLVVFTARRAGRLRAVLPLVAEWATLHGVPVRKLRSPSNVYSCRFDLTAGVADAEEAVRAIWQALRQRGAWDVVELCDVSQGGLGEQLLAAAANDGFPTDTWDTPAAPYLSLAALGDTSEARWEALQQGLNAKFRSSLRRRQRHLEGEGTVQMVCEEAAHPAALSSFYALERSGWKGQEGTAIACDSRLRLFYDTIAAATAGEWRFFLYRLDCGQQTIARQFCVADETTCYLLKPAYDERFSRFSPGNLLVYATLRDLLQRGFAAYDLLSPQADWKGRWTKTVRPQAHLYIFRRGFLGQALHAWKFRVAQGARRLKRNYQDRTQPRP